MSETEAHDTSRKQLLDRMVEAKQLSSADAETLARQSRQGPKELPQSEEEILRWLANEYAVAYTALEDMEPDRQLGDPELRPLGTEGREDRKCAVG